MLILTAVRSGPIRFMRYDEIEDDVWTISAARMKGRLGKTSDFRVPLSSEALRVVDLSRPFGRGGYLFPGLRKGVISDMTMGQHMRKADLPYRPHGFRSSFRDWVAERTNTPHEIAETSLAHAAGSQVERAYRRTDYLDQRRDLMERWADYVVGNQESSIYAEF